MGSLPSTNLAASQLSFLSPRTSFDRCGKGMLSCRCSAAIHTDPQVGGLCDPQHGARDRKKEPDFTEIADERRRQVTEILNRFDEDPAGVNEAFGELLLNSFERLFVHSEARKRGLRSSSVGGGQYKRIWISRNQDAGQTIPKAVPILQHSPSAYLRAVRETTSEITACGRASKWQQSLWLFSGIRAKPAIMNAFVYSAAMSACRLGGEWEWALFLFDDLQQLLLQPDVICYNSATSVCDAGGQWLVALHLLGELQSKRLQADASGYNAAISACGRGEAWLHALHLLSEMQMSQIEADVISYSAAVNACAACSQWEQAVSIFRWLQTSHVQPNVISYNGVISACEKGTQWRQAMGVLDDMLRSEIQVDTISCTCAMYACTKAGRTGRTLELFAQMQRSGMVMNSILFTAALAACQSEAQWVQAIDIFEQMLSARLVPDGTVYSAAISSCLGARQTEFASALIERFLSSTAHASVVDYSAMISACVDAEQWETALYIFENLRRSGLQLDRVGCNACISALETSAKWEHALSELLGFQHQSLSANEISCSTVIMVLEKAQSWADDVRRLDHTWVAVIRVLDEMRRHNVESTDYDYGAAVSALNKAGLWERAHSTLHSVRQLWRDAETPPLPLDSGRIVALHSRESGVQVLDIVSTAVGVVAVAKPPRVTTEQALAALQAEHFPTQPNWVNSVSRLDAMTSGILVAAVGGEGSLGTTVLRAQFAGRLVRKEYLCLCEGSPLGITGATGEITCGLAVTSDGNGGSRAFVSPTARDARTRYSVLSTHESSAGGVNGSVPLSLILVEPVTGRTHQIRAHMMSLGRPLVSDAVYNPSNAPDQFSWCSRVFLHCRRVALLDASGSEFVATVDLPQDLALAMSSV